MHKRHKGHIRHRRSARREHRIPTWHTCGALASAATLALLGAGLPASADDPDLDRFYDQRVRWSACKGEETPKDLQCGTVRVPLDYARPGRGSLELALARYRATGDSKGSVVLNFGGPGGAGVPQLAYGGKEFMRLTNNYDVVTFDPRGVGRSSPVSCGEGFDEVMQGPDDSTPDEQRTQADLRWLRKAAQRCAEHSGPVLDHIGSVNTSRDLDVLRQALGDDKLNYLGFSYGTRLGAVYAAQFPGRVGRFVLDGVDTLTEPLAEQGRATAEGQQTALDNFITWCAEDVACPFGQDPRAGREQVVELVRSLDAHPVPMYAGGSFSGQDFVAALAQGLYAKQWWPALSRAIALLVEHGEPQALMQFAGTVGASPGGRGDEDVVDENQVPADNFQAALLAINCADNPDRPSGAELGRNIERLRDEYEQASPVFGQYQLTFTLMCYGRPRGTDFIRDRVRDLDTPKMLLVGTRGDPATPYRWTVETARRLGSSAVVLDNRSEGHTGYASSECVHEAVDEFLLYGSLPANGSSCGPGEE
ncbi:alpha/beta hydrolase [Streptomyces cavernae]|uniref:alpha/beta hydrolase n=1 Tax=Streptomyces cavernae TaxID=2259034 RepID=UPI000FEBB631|nr:alpha/beta hydrolase [Streptomyces cavernae]